VTQVDVNIPRFNQACVAILTGVAFMIQAWVLIALVAAVLAATRFAGPRLGLFTQFYVLVVKPRMAGPVESESVEPPRFAQLLGLVFLTIATILLVLGYTTAGWLVTLIVTALATLAATTRICVGCLIYESVAPS
jgi:hypothetical protein